MHESVLYTYTQVVFELRHANSLVCFYTEQFLSQGANVLLLTSLLFTQICKIVGSRYMSFFYLFLLAVKQQGLDIWYVIVQESSQKEEPGFFTMEAGTKGAFYYNALTAKQTQIAFTCLRAY